MIEPDGLYLGDCLEVMKGIADESVDCVICDLPYGTTACAWDSIIPFEPLWAQYRRICKRNAPIVLFGNEPFSTKLRMSNFKCWKYDWIWNKVSKQGFLNAKRRPLKQHELISVFCLGVPAYYPQMVEIGKPRTKGSYNKRRGDGDGCYGKFANQKSFNNVYYPSTILTFSNAVQAGKAHPTQKPLDLLRYLVRTYTREGEVILDNCMGSGTTCVAAAMEGRRFIGIEKDTDYFAVAQQRVSDVLSEKTLFG